MWFSNGTRSARNDATTSDGMETPKAPRSRGSMFALSCTISDNTNGSVSDSQRQQEPYPTVNRQHPLWLRRYMESCSPWTPISLGERSIDRVGYADCDNSCGPHLHDGSPRGSSAARDLRTCLEPSCEAYTAEFGTAAEWVEHQRFHHLTRAWLCRVRTVLISHLDPVCRFQCMSYTLAQDHVKMEHGLQHFIFTPGSPLGTLVIYSVYWCGFCRAARQTHNYAACVEGEEAAVVEKLQHLEDHLADGLSFEAHWCTPSD